MNSGKGSIWTGRVYLSFYQLRIAVEYTLAAEKAEASGDDDDYIAAYETAAKLSVSGPTIDMMEIFCVTESQALEIARFAVTKQYQPWDVTSFRGVGEEWLAEYRRRQNACDGPAYGPPESPAPKIRISEPLEQHHFYLREIASSNTDDTSDASFGKQFGAHNHAWFYEAMTPGSVWKLISPCQFTRFYRIEIPGGPDIPELHEFHGVEDAVAEAVSAMLDHPRSGGENAHEHLRSAGRTLRPLDEDYRLRQPEPDIRFMGDKEHKTRTAILTATGMINAFLDSAKHHGIEIDQIGRDAVDRLGKAAARLSGEVRE